MAKAIVAAGPLDLSTSMLDDSNRMQPGTGHLDFANALPGPCARSTTTAGTP